MATLTPKPFTLTHKGTLFLTLKRGHDADYIPPPFNIWSIITSIDSSRKKHRRYSKSYFTVVMDITVALFFLLTNLEAILPKEI
jgi:hypothetical protein